MAAVATSVKAARPQLLFPGRGRPGANRWALFVIPPLVFLAVVFAYPLLVILVRSVTEPELGLQNYERFFSTPEYREVLVRTLWISGLVTAVCVALGYPYAYFMTRVGPTMRRVLIFFVLVPFWTSLLVRTYD